MNNTIHIKNLLDKRIKTPLRIKSSCDTWLQEIVESNKEYEYFIELSSFGVNREYKEYREQLFSKYYLNAIIDLANFLPQTGVKLNLYIFSKKQPDKIKIAIYKESIKLIGYKYSFKNPCLELPESYPQKYELYLSEVENYINNNIKPDDNRYCEFNEILYKDLEIDNLSPDRYSKDYFKLQELLMNENTITLGECAEVIRPKVDTTKNKDEKVSTLRANDFRYPLEEENLSLGPITDTILKKGDILAKPYGGFNVYLIAEEPKTKIYAGPNDFVIRAKDKNYSPEYLYLYFRSETYQNIAQFISKGVAQRFISKNDLLETKVIIPNKKEQDYYKNLFKLENNKIQDFSVIQSIVANNQFDKKEKLEDILDAELISKAKSTKDETLSKILEEDLNEINACYKAKAYKATLILCGSVLEAFILDWLNEIQPEENWLNRDEFVAKDGSKRKMGLDYYISKVAKISTPPWMQEMKNNANSIKDKRNLVHAKLCLRDDVKINDEICQEVISYLKEIINMRY